MQESPEQESLPAYPGLLALAPRDAIVDVVYGEVDDLHIAVCIFALSSPILTGCYIFWLIAFKMLVRDWISFLTCSFVFSAAAITDSSAFADGLSALKRPLQRGFQFRLLFFQHSLRRYLRCLLVLQLLQRFATQLWLLFHSFSNGGYLFSDGWPFVELRRFVLQLLRRLLLTLSCFPRRCWLLPRLFLLLQLFLEDPSRRRLRGC